MAVCDLVLIGMLRFCFPDQRACSHCPFILFHCSWRRSVANEQLLTGKLAVCVSWRTVQKEEKKTPQVWITFFCIRSSMVCIRVIRAVSQNLVNCCTTVGTSCTIGLNPQQIEVMELQDYGRPTCNKLCASSHDGSTSFNFQIPPVTGMFKNRQLK